MQILFLLHRLPEIQATVDILQAILCSLPKRIYYERPADQGLYDLLTLSFYAVGKYKEASGACERIDNVLIKLSRMVEDWIMRHSEHFGILNYIYDYSNDYSTATEFFQQAMREIKVISLSTLPLPFFMTQLSYSIFSGF